ncbi:Fic family protein [Stenotrophomonas sp. NPDC077464]|uniref:Fic family protein n=1 Tax=unclassified Stenotrophomonas TaxID=196198 RepID=UPI0037D2D083
MPTTWIWQRPDWPTFRWEQASLASLLRACVQAQGHLIGLASAESEPERADDALDTLLASVITSSAIEGERLNVASVRASLARRLGMDAPVAISARSEGLADLTLDAISQHDQPLDLARLLQWHRWLFPADDSFLPSRIRVGALRGTEPMQVVSGRIDRPTVHFEAPPREGLDAQVEAFMAWFAASRDDATLDPLLRAGIAHFWLITLHPFDDGNGRLSRAVTDLALAQAQPQVIRFHALSASILHDRAGYYRVLEAAQKGDLDITAWLEWFLATLQHSLVQAIHRIDAVLAKARFWRQHRQLVLSAAQMTVLNRLLDDGERGFEGGINSSQYQAVAKVSRATASRHLAELVELGCLRRLPGGGRSTRYQISDRPLADPVSQER